MAGYGFRLYTVKLVAGANKSKAVPFDKCGALGDEHVSVWLRRAFALLESYDPLTGPPVMHHAVDEDELPDIASYVREPSRGEYRTDFVGHSDAPSTRLSFSLYYGRTGKVSVGVVPDSPMRLDHVPTGDAYRGILYLPPTGTLGLLALESVPSAPNPQRMLNAWLARAAIDLMEEDTASLRGVTLPEGVKANPQPFKLNFNQYPNLARIEKAVKNNPAAKVVLRRDEVDGAGTPTDEQVVITSTLRSQEKRDNAATMARNLVRKAVGKLDDDEDAITLEDLEELVDGSLEGIEWTEGYIQIDDETGLKKIGVDHVDQYFIYPVNSATPLKAAAFEKAVAKEVVDLQSLLGIELDLA
ncbi:hypothetical protein [Pimelobacter simplex]|uniref:hypothetical protein n=1 Tax=Nocardioides simplex TaxID=2045 RepID=UPI003AAB6873